MIERKLGACNSTFNIMKHYMLLFWNEFIHSSYKEGYICGERKIIISILDPQFNP
jgi:hypothetical protein